MRLFLLLVMTGGFGGLAGSVVGATFGPRALLVGGLLGGLIASPCAALLAARFHWIEAADVKSTALGAAIGFIAAAAVAVNTLSSPVGPLLSPLLVGAGGLAGRQLHARSTSRRAM